MRKQRGLYFISIFLLLFSSVQSVNAIQNGTLVPNSPLVVPINTPSRPGFSFTCSGALITPIKVVTAAHCVFDKAGKIPDSIKVGLPGSSDAINEANMASWKRVIKVETLPGLKLDNVSTDQGDIAILSLEAAMTKSPSIKIASEEQIKSLISNQDELVLLGYGVTDPGVWPDYPSKLSGKINKGRGQREFEFITPLGRMCDGDSGGPIFYQNGDSYFYVGAVSRSGGIGACGTSALIATFLYPYLTDFNLSLEEVNGKEVVVSPSPKQSAVEIKKITISCLKGKITKKVTGVNPKCPVGYKKK